ncbi:stage V sporulation protein B [Lachnospiraceae bacterium KM106-2]|nr:stage V sporulation protein B [Lachnospiraceae bacterium KM106-2]
MSKNKIIKGTLILTLAGFATRIIGFFYRIYISKYLGAENMGVYQLVFPVYGICFTLYASGIQTSISKLVAAQVGKGAGGTRNVKRILHVGMACSLAIACTLSLLVHFKCDFIATRLVAEPKVAPSLRVLSYVFPFCGITAVINGYYYGLKKTFVPATTQLLEQIVRVVSIYFLASAAGGGDVGLTCELAVLGLVIGELVSNLYNIISLRFGNNAKRSNEPTKLTRKRIIIKDMFSLVIPLTSNRLLVSLLNSMEAILIPVMLRQAGLSSSESLSIFGILTGMSLPFIMFPSTITNSFSVLLLPTVSEAQAVDNDKLISRTTSITIKYCLIIGILSTGIFIVFGNALGTLIYHNATAGDYIVTLAWLCPFLYLTTTLASIINGLGKAYLTFVNSVIGLSIRILFVVFIIPKEGITGYLTGLLISQLIISTLDIIAVARIIKLDISLVDCIAKPGIIIFLISFLFSRIYTYFVHALSINALLILAGCALFFVAAYLMLLFVTRAVTLKEFR